MNKNFKIVVVGLGYVGLSNAQLLYTVAATKSVTASGSFTSKFILSIQLVLLSERLFAFIDRYDVPES